MYVGFAKIDITPPQGLPLGGYIRRGNKHAVGVMDRLYARVSAIDSSDQVVVVVLLELLAVDADLAAAIRAALQNDGEEIEVITCCTHTHSAPDVLMEQPASETTAAEMTGYRDFVVARVRAGFELARKAIHERTEVDLYYSEAAVDGVAANRIDPDRFIDNTVRVLAVRSRTDGRLMGVVANFACHPTVLGHDNFLYSGDIFGRAMDFVEWETKSICLLTNGASGDVSTRFTRQRQTHEEVHRLGRILADRILACLGEGDLVTDRTLWCHTARCILPLQELPSADEIAARIAQLRTEVAREGASCAGGEIRKRESIVEGLEAMLGHAVHRRETTAVAVLTALRLGNVSFVTVPGELTQTTRREIISSLPGGERVVLLGLSNDYLGYFPTADMIAAGTYEALASRFDSEATQILTEHIVELLSKPGKELYP
ncbi:MAG: hypothetical protein GX195_01010 [Firmicutes bacterium]|nr:hypothetical protein [Bacillota bacterium]